MYANRGQCPRDIVDTLPCFLKPPPQAATSGAACRTSASALSRRITANSSACSAVSPRPPEHQVTDTQVRDGYKGPPERRGRRRRTRISGEGR